MAEFHLKKFYTNETVFKEGTKGDSAYLLKAGRIEIFLEDGGQKIVLANLNPPSVFGEMAILSQEHKRTASAKALEYTELLEIDRAAFGEFMDKSPAIISHLLKSLVERLQKTLAKVSNGPDLFIGTCEILNLLAQHTPGKLDYDQTVRSIASALNVEASKVKEKIELLKALNLVDLSSIGSITILKRDTFLLSARKIYNNTGRQF